MNEKVFEKIRNRLISDRCSLWDALKKMDEIGQKLLFVCREDRRFAGILTIGDLQRAIIRKNDTTLPVGDILSGDKIFASDREPVEAVREKMLRLRAECMPVLDAGGELTEVYFWKDLFLREEAAPAREVLDLPVVIMAGGQGTRLRPLTHVLPKPLIPIGEKTILEEIMDRFEASGCRKFYLSVHYKADMIEYYLGTTARRHDVTFLREPEPLGTIGGISLLKDRVATPFFVSNCDILIDQDFREVYEYHRNNGNDLTVVTALKSLRLPYGVIRTERNGLLARLTEKPEKTFMINTGVYLLQPELTAEIPPGESCDATQLIDRVRRRGGKVGCFPVSGGAWTDMGDWDEYLRQIKQR